MGSFSFDTLQQYNNMFAKVENGTVYYSEDSMSAMLNKQASTTQSRRPWTSSRRDDVPTVASGSNSAMPPARSTVVSLPTTTYELVEFSPTTKPTDATLFSINGQPTVSLTFGWHYEHAASSVPILQDSSGQGAHLTTLRNLEQDWVFSATVQPPSVTQNDQDACQTPTHHGIQTHFNTPGLLTSSSPICQSHHDLNDHSSEWQPLIAIADLPDAPLPPLPLEPAHTTSTLRRKCTVDELIEEAANENKRRKTRHDTMPDLKEDDLFFNRTNKGQQNYETPGSIQGHRPNLLQHQRSAPTSKQSNTAPLVMRSTITGNKQAPHVRDYEPYARIPAQQRSVNTAPSSYEEGAWPTRTDMQSHPIPFYPHYVAPQQRSKYTTQASYKSRSCENESHSDPSPVCPDNVARDLFCETSWCRTSRR